MNIGQLGDKCRETKVRSMALFYWITFVKMVYVDQSAQTAKDFGS